VIGVVKFFDRKGKYGFIVPQDGTKDVFFHETALDGGSCEDGQPVKFEFNHFFPKEKPRAQSVTPLGKQGHAPVQELRKVAAHGD
jgi:cold shock CspA family protein